MKPLLFGAICAALMLSAAAQGPQAAAITGPMLNFEMQHTGNIPTGWGGGPPGTIFVDTEIVHGGRSAARLERNAASPDGLSALTKGIPIDFAGTRIEWRGFLRTEDVREYVGLWMREDGDTPGLAFDNMQQRQVKGTRDWTEYSINMPLHPAAKQLFFGVLVAGSGKVWVDDLQLLVDGKPVWEAPKVERKKTPFDIDHEFDSGSGITITELTKTQIENLAMLGKMWGFLKYHHPAVVSGQRHWDYDLFRVLPKVLAADKRETAEGALLDWIRGLGEIPACTNCITLDDKDLQQTPPTAWINQESEVGRDLADLLNKIYRTRSRQPQFYVSAAPGIGNPVFDHELPYPALRFPDAGYQLLSLYRYWNMIEYWYPNRDILDQDWNEVLAEFIPRMALAKSKDAYQLETIELIGRITDTHANLWSAPSTLRPPAGTCQIPVTIRFIENRPVVTGYLDATRGPATGLKIGDVIETLDGSAVNPLVEQWRPYYPASNRPTQLRDIAHAITRGNCVETRLGIRRDGQPLNISTTRVPGGNLNSASELMHDLPGDAFRLLSPEVAYLKLSSVKMADAANYINKATGTKGLVIDIRNYPSEFMVFALGELLVSRPTPFARFTAPDVDNPGAIRWVGTPMLTPKEPHYSGKVVILVDENSQSQAEYTAMAFRSAPGALVVGSTTAGADGNVSQINLPGGLSTMISGLGVYYPDKKPTQRIGIIPDIESRPTIAGIRAGRDEVLETALRQILGPQTPAAQIEKMARP
jgi:hypothetical protein